MSRNSESRFALNPTRIDIQRSSFNRSSSVKTSFNVGELVPFYVDEVLPGDTFRVQTSKVVRLQTLITPMMDNLYLDTYYFFVPNRLVWNHWKEFMGENTENAWIQQTEYNVPVLNAPTGGWQVGTIADYLGVPTGVEGFDVSALPFRAYALICDQWFRDENLTDPLNISLGDATQTGTNGSNYVSDVALGGSPFKVSKYHDYFTSSLPSPQKGPSVAIPVAQMGNLPVYSTPDLHNPADMPHYNNSQYPVPVHVSGARTEGDLELSSTNSSISQSKSAFNPSGYDIGDNQGQSLVFRNLWAIQSGNASAATINQLRLAFQIQKFYERDARGGSRYIELIKSHFGVTSPDSRLQRTEYLGGNRVPIHVNQVIQNSSSDASSPMGNVAGQSLTTDKNNDFTRSFTEHGYVIGVMAVRYDHTYQQGLERHFSRRTKFDYYFPLFANIGETPIKNREIYLQSDSVVDDSNNVINDQVFGYQEAWAEYRYKPNRVSGEMRSSYSASLDKWHLADDYQSLPYLSDSWIREDSSTVDRVLAVKSTVSDQVFADIYVKNVTTRPMPMYSIPGLIDHH